MSSNNSIYNPICEKLGITPITFEYGLPEAPEDSKNGWGSGIGDLNNFYGKTHTDESKKLMSDATKARIAREGHHMTDKTHTEEAKNKMKAYANSDEFHCKGTKQSAETIAKRVAKITGMKHSEEARKNISEGAKKSDRYSDARLTQAAEHSEKMKGHAVSDETKQKMRDAQTGEKAHMFGKTHSDETKLKMSLAGKGKCKKKLTCPHCNLTGGSNGLKRYHFDNCKHKNI